MRDLVLASGDVEVGEHKEFTLLGMPFNVDTVISTGIAAVLVIALAIYLSRKATAGVPSGLQMTFEGVTNAVEKQVESSLGIRTAPFVVPLAIGLFVFILISNWLGLVPHAWDDYIRPPTSDVNLTFAMAAVVIILVHLIGIRTKGLHYFAHFTKPYKAMLPLNIIEEITKPVTLALRLFGNMLSAGVMVSVLALLPAAVLWAPTGLWKLFDLFIGFLQALIFALLTILYFGFAAGPEDGEEHSKAHAPEGEEAKAH